MRRVLAVLLPSLLLGVLLAGSAPPAAARGGAAAPDVSRPNVSRPNVSRPDVSVPDMSGPAAGPHDPPGRPRTVPAEAGTDYSPPVRPLNVVRGFDPPPGPYAAGHRGVDLAVTPGQAVLAAASGTVGFAGTVAGRGVVVLVHADGVSTEYEPIDPAVATGQVVRRGAVIGAVVGTHDGCAPGRCLHWGARRGGDYFDPLTLLRRLGPVRLLPW